MKIPPPTNKVHKFFNFETKYLDLINRYIFNPYSLKCPEEIFS